jgi:hypothetical protein
MARAQAAHPVCAELSCMLELMMGMVVSRLQGLAAVSVYSFKNTL